MNDLPVAADYDGDGKIDLAAYTPSSGIWTIQRLGGVVTYQWGLPGDVPVPGDYDGDGKADLAVYRPSNGVWYIRQSSSVRMRPSWQRSKKSSRTITSIPGFMEISLLRSRLLTRCEEELCVSASLTKKLKLWRGGQRAVIAVVFTRYELNRPQ